MELVIRKYFWAVNLCFVALVALLAAKTVNLFIEAAIAPAPSAPAGRAGGRTVGQQPPATLDLARLAGITNLPLPAPESHDDAPKSDMSAEPVRTSLRIKLLGTLVSTLPGWSIGSLLDLGNQKSSTVMVGDRGAERRGAQHRAGPGHHRQQRPPRVHRRRGGRRCARPAAHRHHPSGERARPGLWRRHPGAGREQLRGPQDRGGPGAGQPQRPGDAGPHRARLQGRRRRRASSSSPSAPTRSTRRSASSTGTSSSASTDSR